MRHILLEGVVGSTAYGLNHADSDIDKLGVFIYPTETILGLTSPKDTVSTTNPDRTIHEVGKFIRLCLAANPTVMELLWLPDYTTCNLDGNKLVENRDIFLSQKVRNTYGGYARQQAKKLAEKGNFGSGMAGRQAKHGRHCARLLLQGIEILRTNTITVRLSDEQAKLCRHMGALAAVYPDAFELEIEKLFVEFDDTSSTLPKEPDYSAANALLIQLRKDYL